jgi:menaquinone-dependent protoporphyrinogen oxidase
MKTRTRREFILNVSRASAAALTALVLGPGVALPWTAQGATIDFPEMTCGGDSNKGPRVLVAYASRCGSTGGVAERIGQVLCEMGARAEVRLVERVTRLDPYQALIVGSAVRSDQWLPEAVDLLRANRAMLDRIPVALFLTCLTMSRANAENREKAGAYLEPVLKTIPELQPVDSGFFAGALDYGKLSWPMRVIMRQKMRDKGIEEGDYRDWGLIRAWATALHQKLLTAWAGNADPRSLSHPEIRS